MEFSNLWQMRSNLKWIYSGLKSPDLGFGTAIDFLKNKVWMKIHKRLWMNHLRIKVIIMNLKPNKIVKLKLFFGVNIGLSPYDKKIYLSVWISQTIFVSLNGEKKRWSQTSTRWLSHFQETLSLSLSFKSCKINFCHQGLG